MMIVARKSIIEIKMVNIESISYKVDDSGQKDYYRNKNGEYKISWELYSLILEEYPISAVDDNCMIKKVSNK